MFPAEPFPGTGRFWLWHWRERAFLWATKSVATSLLYSPQPLKMWGYGDYVARRFGIKRLWAVLSPQAALDAQRWAQSELSLPSLRCSPGNHAHTGLMWCARALGKSNIFLIRDQNVINGGGSRRLPERSENTLLLITNHHWHSTMAGVLIQQESLYLAGSALGSYQMAAWFSKDFSNWGMQATLIKLQASSKSWEPDSILIPCDCNMKEQRAISCHWNIFRPFNGHSLETQI